jgi:hypothetical protein
MTQVSDQFYGANIRPALEMVNVTLYFSIDSSPLI